jgi:hypothetical protein
MKNLFQITKKNVTGIRLSDLPIIWPNQFPGLFNVVDFKYNKMQNKNIKSNF